MLYMLDFLIRFFHIDQHILNYFHYHDAKCPQKYDMFSNFSAQLMTKYQASHPVHYGVDVVSVQIVHYYIDFMKRRKTLVMALN